MGKRDSYPQGLFSWVDLATSDPTQAKAFYSALFGWTFQDAPVGPGKFYCLAKRGEHSVAALYDLDPKLAKQGVPPHWNSYITVDDVDAMLEQATAIGATKFCEPFDVMDAGRMCTIADPTGAAVNLWQPKKNIGAQWVNDPGCFGWNELNTRDVPAAREFWGALLGWTFTDETVGSAPYTLIKNGTRSNGGMLDMTGRVPDEVPPHWNVYFTVAELDTSVKTAKDHGGTVLVPATSIGVGRIAVIRDPQGATFTLFEGQVED